MSKSIITHTQYFSHEFVRNTSKPDKFSTPIIEEDTLHWIDFSACLNPEQLTTILEPYHIHELVVEDICNARQQPKVELYDDYIFLVSRAFKYKSGKLQGEQISMIIKANIVMTFRNGQIPIFEPMGVRFDHQPRDDEDFSAGFLAYTLLDCLVDDYFDVTEHLIDKIEKSDRKLFSPDSKLTLAKAHTLRLEAGKLRRYMRRTNDSVIQLMRAPHPLIDNHTKVYFRDIADHCSQMLDTLDGARDTISSITDTYLNIQSNQLNLQMRLLTVITIIFMPLTLLSGIYGMNFDYMPELKYHYAYFILLGVMATIVIVLLIVFRKKRWL